MAFVGKPRTINQHFETPEELYLRGGLPRKTDAVPGLWVHQGDVLRAFAREHGSTADLALELPTGTGKTLPGLLIAEWVRRKSEGPVLYATPTRQLARQVHETAKTEGLPARLLVGSHRHWDVAEQAEVDGGSAIAITTYSSIFNSSPKVPVPRLIVLDDAHAGEQFVGEQYAISINRYADGMAYRAVLGSLRPFLSGIQIQRLEGDPDPGAHHQVRLILPAADPDALRALDGVLSQLGEPHKYQLAMVRSGLPSCCVYLSYGGIQIRPMLPPTFENKVFSGALQRVYLSATLGSGGELERAFGRPEVTRMPLPTKTPPRSGRRLFVFPDLVEGGDSFDLTKQIVGITNKAVVLSQDSTERTEEVAEMLAADNVTVFGKSAVEDGLSKFINANQGVLGLANRYDGMDLPGDACRVVVLGGKPDTVSLQEKFLSERAQAGAALSERIRTRVVQGAGRCTRGPNDYAVVIVLGPDITRYFSKPENTSALEEELQAEVGFGWANSKGQSAEFILDNVRTFLDHGAAWRGGGEPLVAEFRDEAVKKQSPGAAALGEAAKSEVAAWQSAFSGDWMDASQQLEEAARTVGKGGEATRGYRALLLYLAGAWVHLGAADEGHRAHGRQLIRNAQKATGGTWLKEMKEFPGAEKASLSGADVVAVDAIATRLQGQLKPNKIRDDLDAMLAGLSQSDAVPYEQALTALGTFLGAQAFKPTGTGRCDSAWLWDTSKWLTIEAKSEEHANGLLPLHDIRQANTQLDQLAADRSMDHPPAGSPAILVSNRLSVDPQHAAVANPNVYLASTEAINWVAGDARAVWIDILSAAARQEPLHILRQHVQASLSENGCLPTQIIDRLTRERIRPGE